MSVVFDGSRKEDGPVVTRSVYPTTHNFWCWPICGPVRVQFEWGGCGGKEERVIGVVADFKRFARATANPVFRGVGWVWLHTIATSSFWLWPNGLEEPPQYVRLIANIMIYMYKDTGGRRQQRQLFWRANQYQSARRRRYVFCGVVEGFYFDLSRTLIDENDCIAKYAFDTGHKHHTSNKNKTLSPFIFLLSVHFSLLLSEGETRTLTGASLRPVWLKVQIEMSGEHHVRVEGVACARKHTHTTIILKCTILPAPT